jgi:hypothetical protein
MRALLAQLLGLDPAHYPQGRQDELRSGPKPHHHGHVLHVPALAEHQDAYDHIHRARALVHVMGSPAGALQIFLAYLGRFIGMDDKGLVAAEFRRIGRLQPFADFAVACSILIGLRF